MEHVESRVTENRQNLIRIIGTLIIALTEFYNNYGFLSIFKLS